MNSREVRFGIVGNGTMGRVHAKAFLDEKISRGRLAAVCDINPESASAYPDIAGYTDASELIRSGEIDALLIATPHYDHTTIGIAALEAGLHVLVEKPISVHKADCERLIAARRGRDGLVFAAMLNQRTDPFYKKIRQLVHSGELGKLQRVNWLITNWFRTEAYYASGGWRATWAGEGGGVLLNQCPHNLDLWQWIFGMPARVRAWCAIGKYHDIEVEDEVTAYLEYDNGCTGVFVTSTGEAPGTNRLEVTGERGRLLYEADSDTLTYRRNEIPAGEFSRTTPERFATPEVWDIRIPCSGHGGQHVEVIQNFVDAILDGKPLIAPGNEGIHSVELANAMLLSAFEERTISLPLDSAVYESFLKKKIAESRYVKPVTASVLYPGEDFSKSFR